MSETGSSLRQAALGGVVWTAGSQGVRQAIQVGVTAVLAWHLQPDDFGLISMVAVSLAMAAPLNDLGLGSAIVQRKDLERGHAAAAFWAQVLIASALAGIVAGAAPLVAGFFQRSELTPLIRIMCVGLPLSAAGAVPQALLLRGLQFDRIAVIETVALAGSGSVAIGMAVSGWGVTSLVAQSLIGTGLTTTMVLASSRFNPFSPGSHPRWRHLMELVGFGAPLMGYQFLNFISRNIDDILIGRFLGAEALGYYSMAYRVMMYPLQKVSDVVGRVCFPTFSSIQDEPDRIRSAYLRVVQLIALVTFPMMAAMMIVAPEFTAVLFGPSWGPVAPLLAVLAVAGMIGSIGTTTGTVFLARGRSDLMLKWEIVASICYTVAIVIGLEFGLMGVAVCVTAMSLMLWPLSHLLANRLIGLSLGRLYRVLVSPAALAAVIATALVALRLLWRPGTTTEQILFLAACSLAGGFILITAALLGRPAGLREAVALVRETRFRLTSPGQAQMPPG